MISVQVVIIRYHIEEEPKERWYEELILKVATEDKEEAVQKAVQYAEQYCKDYKNCNKHTVKGEVYKIIDTFEVFAEENGVQEVYSKFWEEDFLNQQ